MQGPHAYSKDPKVSPHDHLVLCAAQITSQPPHGGLHTPPLLFSPSHHLEIFSHATLCETNHAILVYADTFPTMLYRLLKNVYQSSSTFFSLLSRSSHSGRQSSGFRLDWARAREASRPAKTGGYVVVRWVWPWWLGRGMGVSYRGLWGKMQLRVSDGPEKPDSEGSG